MEVWDACPSRVEELPPEQLPMQGDWGLRMLLQTGVTELLISVRPTQTFHIPFKHDLQNHIAQAPKFKAKIRGRQ